MAWSKQFLLWRAKWNYLLDTDAVLPSITTALRKETSNMTIRMAYARHKIHPYVAVCTQIMLLLALDCQSLVVDHGYQSLQEEDGCLQSHNETQELVAVDIDRGTCEWNDGLSRSDCSWCGQSSVDVWRGNSTAGGAADGANCVC